MTKRYLKKPQKFTQLDLIRERSEAQKADYGT